MKNGITIQCRSNPEQMKEYLSDLELNLKGLPGYVLDKIREPLLDVLGDLFSIEGDATLAGYTFAIKPTEFAISLLAAIRAGEYDVCIAKIHEHSSGLKTNNSTNKDK